MTRPLATQGVLGKSREQANTAFGSIKSRRNGLLHHWKQGAGLHKQTSEEGQRNRKRWRDRSGEQAPPRKERCSTSELHTLVGATGFEPAAAFFEGSDGYTTGKQEPGNG